MISISIQEDDFDHGEEYQFLCNNNHDAGAIVTFCGRVREFDQGKGQKLILEHYPEMTEKALNSIVKQAYERWSLLNTRVIHRIGSLQIHEQIVFVGVSSAHRKEAFAACEFIMDYLKTQAPFWKKAETEDSSYWVEAKQADQHAQQKWEEKE